MYFIQSVRVREEYARTSYTAISVRLMNAQRVCTIVVSKFRPVRIQLARIIAIVYPAIEECFKSKIALRCKRQQVFASRLSSKSCFETVKKQANGKRISRFVKI